MSTIIPKNTALLVMDYQNGIAGRMPNIDEIVVKMKRTIETARQAGITIGYVRVAFADEDYEKVPPTNKAFAGYVASRGMHADDEATQIDSRIAPKEGDIVVRKVRYGAFSTTDLDKQLRARGIDTLILAGFSTSGVVLSTVRDAADKDYAIFVLEDLTGDPKQEVHDMLMQHVFPRQAEVITSDELTKLLAL